MRNGKGPLEGLVVVDASFGMPAAVATMVLADHGARVIKVERPGGAGSGTARRTLDRGKWSVEADVRTEAGRDVLLGLLANADVFVESFGAGKLTALGLDYDALRDRFPELVYVSVTGYGTDGPFADRPGYDALVAARMGVMAEQRGHRDGPIFLGHPTIAYGTAFLTLIGTLSALRARSRTGAGQLVETSVFDGWLQIASMNWWWNEKNISYLAREGKQTGFGNKRLITDPFECADGKWLIPHTGGPGSYKKLMDLLGFGEQTPAIDGPEMAVPLSEIEVDIARNRVPAAFKTRPRDEWLEILHAADVAALPVNHPDEVFRDDQVEYAKVVVDIEDDEFGTVRQVGPVVRFSETSPATPTRAPRLGEHTHRVGEIRRDPRWSPRAERTALDAPLQGMRIVDFSSFFATGFGARLLSDMGAEVVKVEPLVGDQMRPLGDLFEGSQRGKRSLAIDLRTPQGQEVARRLVSSADVVMHNFRPGKIEKLGLSYDDVRSFNPDVIYAYLPGFGSTGPKSTLKSFAPLQSGLVGLNFEGAGEGNPPIRRALGNEDLYNGFLGAVSVLLALAHREQTGQGQYIESPQMHSSLFVISEHCTDAEGNPVPAHVLDSDQTGWGPLYRLYRTSDGWIAIAVIGDRRFDLLAKALDRPQWSADPRFATAEAREAHAAVLAQVLEARFAELTSAEAFRLLDAAGVPAEIPLDYPIMPELLWDETMLETGRVFEKHHPEHGWIREVGHTIRLSKTPPVDKGTSVPLGAHNREILAELGYGRDEIDTMLRTICALPGVSDADDPRAG